MNYKNKLFIVLGLLGLASQSSYAYLKSVHVWRVPKKNGGYARVIILGDHHQIGFGSQEHVWDQNHKKIVLNALEIWKDQKMTFLLESNQDEYDSMERTLAKIKEKYSNRLYIELLQEMRRVAYDNKHRYGSIEFKEADLRTDAIRYFLDLMPQMNGLSGEDLKKHLEIFDMMNPPIATSQFIQEIDTHIQYLQKYKAGCDQDSVMGEILRNYLVTLTQAQAWATEYADAVLDGHRELPIKDIFLNCREYDIAQFEKELPRLKIEGASEEEKSLFVLDCLKKRVERANAQLSFAYNQLFWQLPDAGFLVALDEHLNEAENIVYFLGHGHAVELNQYLEKIGATLIKYAGARIKESLKPVDDKELEVLLKHALSDESSLNEVLSKKEFCYNCKEAVEQMKRCGKCKTAKYCTKACQVKDWESHKLVCKK